MDKEQSRKYLDKQPRAVIKHMSKAKTVKTFMKIFNSLCLGCRAKVLKHPALMKMDKFCQDCQDKIKAIGGE